MSDWVELGRKFLPQRLRHAIQRLVPMTEAKRRWRARREPLSGITGGEGDGSYPGIRVGILATLSHDHSRYVAACQELGLAFSVLDVARDDWQTKVMESGCNPLMAWPDATLTPWAAMYKDRCDLIESELGIPVYPGRLERWLYEDKIRTRDWLLARFFPMPETHVFFEREEALAFVAACSLPRVFKTSFGAGSTGVRIVRSRSQLRRIVRRAFSKGFVPAGHDRRDRQWRHVLLQEYLPEVREWRMVRIGDSFFGHPKGRRGEFHSGSGRVEWEVPGEELLDLLRHVTDSAGIRSIAMDVFETVDGRFLINELQTVFGASTSVHQLKVDGRPGRMLVDEDDKWKFEAGDFARNACANARIMNALRETTKK